MLLFIHIKKKKKRKCAEVKRKHESKSHQRAFSNVVLVSLSIVEICIGEKVLEKYVFCYLNNENYY